MGKGKPNLNRTRQSEKPTGMLSRLQYSVQDDPSKVYDEADNKGRLRGSWAVEGGSIHLITEAPVGQTSTGTTYIDLEDRLRFIWKVS